MIRVADANGCAEDTAIMLNAPPLISFTYIRTDSVSCADSSDGHIVVNATGGTPGLATMYTYAINSGTAQVDSNFNNLAAGTYQIVVYDSLHCSLDTSLTVYAPLPVSLAVDPLDTVLPLGGSIELSLLISNVTTQNITGYVWSPADGLSCIDCPNPVATPYQRQNYTVVLRYGKNCTTSASALLEVGDGAPVYIPNAFSPNGDGTNDEFTAFGSTLKSVSMKIFNRWGEKVFDSMDSQWASWDGTYKGAMQPTGVYVYTAEIIYLNGHKETRNGSLTLIR
jgi:gliding motility-associated-like protein